MAVNLGADLTQEWLMAKQILRTLIPVNSAGYQTQTLSDTAREDAEYFMFGYIYKYINNLSITEFYQSLSRKDHLGAATILGNYSINIDRKRVADTIGKYPLISRERKSVSRLVTQTQQYINRLNRIESLEAIVAA